MDTFNFAEVVGSNPPSAPATPIRHRWVSPFRPPFCAGDDRCHGCHPWPATKNVTCPCRNQCCFQLFLPDPRFAGLRWPLTPQRLTYCVQLVLSFALSCLFEKNQYTTPKCALCLRSATTCGAHNPQSTWLPGTKSSGLCCRADCCTTTVMLPTSALRFLVVFQPNASWDAKEQCAWRLQ